jgi:beta-lactamase class A
LYDSPIDGCSAYDYNIYMYPTVALDGLQRTRRISQAPLDLRTMIAPVGALPVSDPLALSSRAPIRDRVNPFTVVEETSRRSSFITYSFVAVALAAAGITAAAYRVNHRTTPVRALTTNARTNNVSTTGNTSSAVAPLVTPKAASIQALLDRFTVNDRANWGIVVMNLMTGETGSINADRQMDSASLYKLFVAQGIFSKLDAGELSYDSPSEPGSSMGTVRQCLNLMITISDNTCGNALGAKLGWNAYNPALTAAGYTSTDLMGPYMKTSASDVAKLLQRIHAGTLNSPASNAALLTLLKAQTINDRLPQGLPSGTVIAHKTGDLEGYVHDAGIVYGPKSDYVVVAMSGSWNYPGTAAQRIADLSAQLYAQLEQ